MTYELKDYLKSINKTKEKLMDTDDKMWEKKYPAFIIKYIKSNFCLLITITIILFNILYVFYFLRLQTRSISIP